MLTVAASGGGWARPYSQDREAVWIPNEILGQNCGRKRGRGQVATPRLLPHSEPPNSRAATTNRCRWAEGRSRSPPWVQREEAGIVLGRKGEIMKGTAETERPAMERRPLV